MIEHKIFAMAKKILIVDDERDILDLLQFNLEAEGYKIVCAPDGEKALELAESALPDLIILDIMLPGKDDKKKQSTSEM